MYSIVATITAKDKEGWSKTVQVPTFFLDERCQGIICESHARTIAKHILLSTYLSQNDKSNEQDEPQTHISAVKVDK